MDMASGAQNLDLSKLSPQDQQELRQFVVNENQKAHIQQTVHSLTDTCFKKCVTGTIRSGKLDRSEESCAQNCVDRWLDANITVLKHLEKIRSQS